MVFVCLFSWLSVNVLVCVLGLRFTSGDLFVYLPIEP